MISLKEKELLAVALHWREMYERNNPQIDWNPTIECLLDDICRKVGITLTVAERNEVVSEFYVKHRQKVE